MEKNISPIIIGVLCLSLIADAVSQAIVKHYFQTEVIVRGWEFEEDNALAPATGLSQNLTQSTKDDGIYELDITVVNKSEDFHITVLANPFIENKSNCPPLNISDYDLRVYHEYFAIYKNVSEPPFNLKKIFSGCYYAIATTNDDKHWSYPPVFHQTNYFYLDKRIRVIDSPIFSGRISDAPSTIKISFVLPLDCLWWKARLFENDEHHHIDKIKTGSISKKRMNYFKKVGDDFRVYSNFSYLLKDIIEANNSEVEVTQSSYDKNYDRWTADTIWNIEPDGGYYYLHYTIQGTTVCDGKYGYDNVNTWRLIESNIYMDLGHVSTFPPRPPIKNADFDKLLIVYCLLGLSLALILSYWAVKYRKLLLNLLVKREEPRETEEPIRLLDGQEESNQILLMYEPDSAPFMNEIENLKRSLEQRCNGCEVRDVYAPAEFDKINGIGAPGWVEELLKGGSKIIWIDTPQFRSRCKNTANRYSVIDCRDDAVPYAVFVALDVFQNSKTQYRRHFVVRMKGFEVPEGSGEDPLQVVTPHARYYIPDHLAILCNDLKKAMENGYNHAFRNIETNQYV